VESSLDSAQVEVGLIRVSGTLVVESDFEGLAILIDNMKESYIGRKRKDFVPYGDTVEGKKEFMLPEGSYTITVQRSSRNVQNAQFRIAGDMTTIVKVSYAPGNKALGLQVKNPNK